MQPFSEVKRKMITVSVVCVFLIIAEVIGGVLAQSLAIISDAAHLLSDLSGFMISLISIYLAQRKASHKFTFGFARAEIIGALTSVMLIW